MHEFWRQWEGTPLQFGDEHRNRLIGAAIALPLNLFKELHSDSVSCFPALNQIIGVRSDGFPPTRMFRVMSNAQVTFDCRAADVELIGNFTPGNTQLVQ